jgi:dTDP-glucose 4,6-dehydratase
MILKALDGLPLSVDGDGSNVRDWLNVDDHATRLTVLIERGRPGERYNFGGDSERTNLAEDRRIASRIDALRSKLDRPPDETIPALGDNPS